MHTRKLIAVLIGSGLIAAMPAFAADGTSTSVTTTTTAGTTSTSTTKPPTNGRATARITQEFTSFAGSSANSGSLVTGLRSGTPITLTSTSASGKTTSTTFTPPTRPMGNGNVTISMALAEHQLSSLGITQPTPDQIRAAMVGGTVVGPDGKATNLEGVLTMRAQGMGWGRIAQAQGVKLGQVMSALKSAHARAPGTGGTLPTEHATFKGRHDFQGTDHDARSATTAGGTSRGVTTAAGSATQNRKIEADNRAAASGSSTNASGAPSGRGIVTAAGTGAAGVRVGESGDRSGSHAATTASGSTLGRGITTAGSSGGNTAAASSGIVRADGSGAGSARSGNGFGHR